MRGFEEYCWRDLLSDEMATIYAAYHRERRVAARSVVLVIHPGDGFRPTTGDWHGATAQIVGEARGIGLPILHSIPRGTLAAARVAPQPRDPVFARVCDSAFFFCDLEAVLTRLDATGIILCGAPTSGALRASTIEAKSYGYHAAIAEEAVADESALLHKMALFDLAHKYADVMAVDELIEALRVADPRAIA